MSEPVRVSIGESQLALIATAHGAVQQAQARLLGLVDMALAEQHVEGQVVGWEVKPNPVLIVQPRENGKPE